MEGVEEEGGIDDRGFGGEGEESDVAGTDFATMARSVGEAYASNARSRKPSNVAIDVSAGVPANRRAMLFALNSEYRYLSWTWRQGDSATCSALRSGSATVSTY